VPLQQRRSGPPTLLIHPDDAAPRRIAAGDEVRVQNARGSFFAIAEVSDRVRPGVVASPKGRWPRDSKEGATVNATVDERDSDMGAARCITTTGCASTSLLIVVSLCRALFVTFATACAPFGRLGVYVGALVTVALTVGTTTAIFSVVYGVLPDSSLSQRRTGVLDLVGSAGPRSSAVQRAGLHRLS
jgi:hypothetical protein